MHNSLHPLFFPSKLVRNSPLVFQNVFLSKNEISRNQWIRRIRNSLQKNYSYQRYYHHYNRKYVRTNNNHIWDLPSSYQNQVFCCCLQLIITLYQIRFSQHQMEIILQFLTVYKINNFIFIRRRNCTPHPIKQNIAYSLDKFFHTFNKKNKILHYKIYIVCLFFLFLIALLLNLCFFS
jgi:hypothetical protein